MPPLASRPTRWHLLSCALCALSAASLSALPCPQAAAEPPALYDDAPPPPSLLLNSPCRARPLDAAPPPPARPDPDQALADALRQTTNLDAAADLLKGAERAVVVTVGNHQRLIVASSADGLLAFDLRPNRPLQPLPDLAFDRVALTRDHTPDLMDLRAAPPPSTLVFALYLWADDTASLLSWDAATGQQATVTHTAEPYASITWISPDATHALLDRPLFTDDATLALLDLYPTPRVAPHPQPPPSARRARVVVPHDPDQPPRAWLSPDLRTLWVIAQPEGGEPSLRECWAAGPPSPP